MRPSIRSVESIELELELEPGCCLVRAVEFDDEDEDDDDIEEAVMGALSEFFVGTREEAVQAEAAGIPPGLPRLHARRVDPVKLSTLDEILTGLPGRLPDYIKDDRCDKTLVAPLAPRVVQKLAGLSPTEAAEAAQRWAQTKEWRRDRGSAADLAHLLEALSGLAKQAQGDGKALYVWLSR